MRKKLFLFRKLFGKHRFRGFTLTELLVALVVSSIILASLLFFTTSLVTTNRDEEAKATTQEEITAALNFIANDLQESVFIYGAYALEKNSTDNPPGIADQIPYGSSTPATGVQARDTDRRPILAFWKRNYYDAEYSADSFKTASGVERKVKCLPHPYGTSTENCFGHSKFLYSLVVYYLIKDNDSDWSDTARIARWEIRDGIRWSCVDTSTAAQTDPTKCPTEDGSPSDNPRYVVPPSPGFKLFSTTGAGSLAEKMNRWTKGSGSGSTYNLSTNPLRMLLDFVDDTPYYTQFDDGTSVNLIKIAARRNNPNPKLEPPEEIIPINPDCDSPDKGVGVPNAGAGDDQRAFAERVPETFTETGSENNVYRLSSFYACIANFGNPNQTVARVWIRGNPRARFLLNTAIRKQEIKSKVESCNASPVGKPCSPVDSYFITGDIRVLGRGQFKLE